MEETLWWSFKNDASKDGEQVKNEPNVIAVVQDSIKIKVPNYARLLVLLESFILIAANIDYM